MPTISREYHAHAGRYQPGGNSCDYIVVHNTGNSASALAEARNQQNNFSRPAGAHYFLDGDVPADFDHVTILVDGAPVAEMRSACSVTVDGLAVGSTVSVTATAEDDACLADGTPAHNVSAPCAAVKVTIKDAVAEVRADADAARGLSEQAEAAARATSQHFWHDDSGAHVTQVTQDEWNDQTSTTTYHKGPNALWNALGMLLRAYSTTRQVRKDNSASPCLPSTSR